MQKSLTFSLSRKNIESFLFILGFAIEISGFFLGATTFRYVYGITIFNQIKLLGMLILLVKVIFFSRYTSKEFLLFTILLIISAAIAKNTNSNLVYYLITVVGSKNIKFSNILKTQLCIITPLILIMVYCAVKGAILNLPFISNNHSYFAYGYMYTTDFAAQIFYIILGYSVLRRFKFNLFEYLLLLYLSYFVYLKLGAKLDTVLILLIILISLFFKKLILYNFNTIERKTIPLFALCLVFLFFILGYFYNGSDIYVSLDRFFTNRISQINLGFSRYSFTLLGQSLNMIGNGGLYGYSHSFLKFDYFYIDNSFVYIALEYGVISFIIIIFAIIFALKKFGDEKKNLLVIYLLFAIISSIIDQNFLVINCNLLFLALFAKTDDFLNLNNLKNKELKRV
ncbi:hypothetical protein ETI37_01590 [Lactobacillus mulieris]|uniref:hypothetical protein n=1 Tax=Lactobacillus TaxID=1578 RepID=UPI0001D42981|nr:MULTISPECIES: hypothetical protein [Lactobacillus]EFH29328.1 hypothetical protein HMPREF0526_10931 [Lactobacillus jensenii JV-V16]KAA9245291.1 hypothetical protein F6I33_00925 [Lactobacillus jensenii]MCW8093821.1 hypothetical protein [Lactobacillus mulieris]MCW8124050.1 hypothetical protein [Lactobacillus mulieris]MDK7325220.1 hypothetical protein [Lactobacillus mulieris]